jgi:hypothetical protein
MCNPRRIKIRASRRLAEAWRTEITRTALVSETVTGEAHIVEPLGTGLAAPVRERFEELLADTPGWRDTGEGYRYELPGGYLLYRPDSGELEIVANISDELTAEGTAARAATGVAEGTANAEVIESFYDDGYMGHTKKKAEERGHAAAEQAADTRAREELAARMAKSLAEAEHSLEEAGTEVEEEARAQARLSLAEQRGQRQQELEEAARRRAAVFHGDYLRVVNLPLTYAYRDVLLARARQNDVQNLYYEEHDGVIDIQFEMS